MTGCRSLEDEVGHVSVYLLLMHLTLNLSREYFNNAASC